MNIFITGGTGFIGSALSSELGSSGHNVLVTTRHESSTKGKLTWNPPALIPADIISNIDAVINLAGESITSGRWTKRRKELILSSRINTTRALIHSMQNAHPRPKVLISGSAIGYYGDHGDEYVTEDTPPGTGFLPEVCTAWESEAFKAQELGVRVVIIRLGVVLEHDGGALPQIAKPFKMLAGGYIGSGKQWFSWIHRDDVIGIIKHVIENEKVSGPVNATSPRPVTNKKFSSMLGKMLGVPSFLPVPGFMLKIAYGDFASVLIAGQRAIPQKLLNAGHKFKYPDIEEALKAIFKT